MTYSLQLIEKALELGHEELALLEAGEVDAAGEKALARGQVMAEAWEQREAAELETFREKLELLQKLQGRLTGQAAELKDAIHEELKTLGVQHNRMSGYAKAARTPATHSRFISKTG